MLELMKSSTSDSAGTADSKRMNTGHHHAHYVAEVELTGGRLGEARSSDGILSLKFSVPKEMGGPGEPGKTNPEQLFAAGFAACLQSEIIEAARQFHIEPGKFSINAKVGLGPTEKGGHGLNVEMNIRMPEVTRPDAERLVKEAERTCPYYLATKGNIPVRLNIKETRG